LLSAPLAFGLFGFCKMPVLRVEPMLLVLVALVFIFLMQWAVYAVQKKAKSRAAEERRLSLTAVEGKVRYKVDAFGNTLKLIPVGHQQFLAQLSAHSQYVAIFGSFAYNAVSFLFRPDAVLAPAYGMLMGLAFTTALGVTLFQTFAGASLARLHTVREKDLAAKGMKTSADWSFRASVLSILCFLAAFSLMGFVKQWTYSNDNQDDLSMTYGWLQLGTSILVFMLVLKGLLEIEYAKLDVNAEIEEDQDEVTYNWVAFKEDLQIRSAATSFQVGNVFYEILFATANPTDKFFTWAYFGLAMPTLGLGLGVVNVVIASQMCYVLEILPTTQKKSLFGLRMRGWQNALIAMYTTSLLTWFGHFGFSARLKLPDLQWYPVGLVIGGISVLCFYWNRIRYITSHFERNQSHDRQDR